MSRPGEGKVAKNLSYNKHLRPYGKRAVNKAGRKLTRRDIDRAMADMGLTKVIGPVSGRVYYE